MQQSKSEHNAAIPAALANFDQLPDSAYIRLPVMKGLYGVSSASIWRGVKNLTIPKPSKLKERQVQRTINQLISEGFVTILSNKFGGAPGSSRRYQIVINSLTGVTDDTLTVIEPSLTVRQTSKAKITLSSDGNFENLEGHLDIWKKAYPDLDVQAEIKKAAAWLISNPKRKKSDLARFINGWLSRSAGDSSNSDIMDGVL